MKICVFFLIVLSGLWPTPSQSEWSDDPSNPYYFQPLPPTPYLYSTERDLIYEKILDHYHFENWMKWVDGSFVFSLGLVAVPLMEMGFASKKLGMPQGGILIPVGWHVPIMAAGGSVAAVAGSISVLSRQFYRPLSQVEKRLQILSLQDRIRLRLDARPGYWNDACEKTLIHLLPK